jgi:glycosyltransferase involved in cell wall biosynthesis
MSLPILTVIVVTRNAQNRIAPLLKALAKQSLADELDVLIISIASAAPRLSSQEGLNVTLINRSDFQNLGHARAEGARRARSTLVAFLEDHALPDPYWAEAVYEAFRNAPDMVAVSYSFLNGSPDTYFYRSVFMAEYGALAHPLREGIAPSLVANNVAYRRDPLLAVGTSLGALMEIDYFLQKAMSSDFKITTAPKALLAHQTNRHLGDLLKGHFHYAQLFAVRRVQFEGWSFPKRVVGAAAVPLLVPLLRIKRLFHAVGDPSKAARAAAALPIILLLYFAGALGEAWGLLRLQPDLAERLLWLELESERISA